MGKRWISANVGSPSHCRSALPKLGYRTSQKVAIVNESFVRHFFASPQAALGSI